MVPFETMKRWFLIPFAMSDKRLSVAMADPNNILLQDQIGLLSGCDVDVFYADRESIARVLDEGFRAVLEPGQAGRFHFEGEGKDFAAPVVVETIFDMAVDSRASDIHLEPQAEGFFVRFRIDGMLSTVHMFPVSAAAPITSRIKVLSGMDIAERRLPQDGQITTQIRHKEVDLRVSTLPSKYGEKLVIRVLQKSASALKLECMGFEPVSQSRLEMLLERPQGMVIIAGPTGSGKSTTLYAILNRLKSPFRNIVTLEDPVEYELLATKSKESGVTQVQINPKIGLTFASALRASLRQDPDILMVGEIRDQETADIAMRAAMTGHLVFSTLHTNSSTETITRLRDIGIEPYLIASTLLGILAQRLARILCLDCRQPYAPPQKALRGIVPEGLPSAGLTLYKAKGCPRCQGTGYKGRTGIFEFLEMDEELRRAVLESASGDEIRRIAHRHGMKTLRSGGMAMVLKGVTTVEEVLRVTTED